MTRPVRFGLIAAGTTAPDLLDAAKGAERKGFSSIALNDYFNSTVAPILGLQAMAAATSNIRIATAVLNQDLRHPAVLAKELATLDVLSGGRLEVGIGAGWVRADYEQSGIAFDTAGTRVERLEENIEILRGLFAEGRYSSFGTGGAVVDDLSSFRVESFEERLGWITEAAGDRLDEIELSLMLVFVAITEDVETTARGFLEFLTATVSRYGGEVGNVDVKLQTLLDSPVVAIGTLDDVCQKIQRVRETLGFSYFVMPYGSAPEELAPVVARLAGT